MRGTKFSEMDAAILYAMPKPAVELATLIRHYTFINRAAPPPYAALASCLAKSVAAGILTVSPEGRYSILEEWFEYIHRFDDHASNEIESLIAFEELFTAQTWPAVSQERVLSEDDYRAALASLRR